MGQWCFHALECTSIHKKTTYFSIYTIIWLRRDNKLKYDFVPMISLISSMVVSLKKHHISKTTLSLQPSPISMSDLKFFTVDIKSRYISQTQLRNGCLVLLSTFPEKKQVIEVYTNNMLAQTCHVKSICTKTLSTLYAKH